MLGFFLFCFFVCIFYVCLCGKNVCLAAQLLYRETSKFYVFKSFLQAVNPLYPNCLKWTCPSLYFALYCGFYRYMSYLHVS